MRERTGTPSPRPSGDPDGAGAERASRGEPGLSRRADLVLAEVESLPTLPTLAMRLMRLSSRDDADLKEIIRLIEMDPSLSAKVLSLCRRAEHGLGDRITTVERAVVLLGLDAVRSLVLSIHVFEMSGQLHRPGRSPLETDAADRFDRVGFWQHSIAVACAADLICRDHRGMGLDPALGFVSGLVHDLGKQVLDLILPKAYARVMELAEQRQGNIADYEREYLGLDHHTAGKRLAERWDLPEILHDVIWLHGQRYESLPDLPHNRMIGAVRVADALCRQLHLGWSGNYELDFDIDGVCGAVGLDPQRVIRLAPRLHESLAERSKDLGLSDESSDALLLDSIIAANRQLGRINAVLQRRSRSSSEQNRVLDAICAFHEAVRPDGMAIDTLAEVVRSARSLMGEGLYLTVYQTAPGEPWMLTRYTPDGDRAESRHVESPKDADDGSRDALRLSPPDSLDGSLALIRWLDGRIEGLSGRPGLRVAPLVWSDEAAAVLIHDRQEQSRRLGARQAEALAAIWGGAVAAAAERDAANRLGEELAESNLELVHMQQRLAETQSMARLGELTAGAAHELNNPLTVIRGRSQAMAARMDDERDRKDALSIANAAARLSDLIERLHMIARPPEPRLAGVSVVDLVGLVVRTAKERTKSESVREGVVPIRVVAAGPLPPARLDRELIQQALVEVVVNAIEASPRGSIEVRVQTDPLDDRLLFQVVDDGNGMSEHAMRHALDPFFSEKPAGRQPGLGLPLAHSLVRLHGGSISFVRHPNGGTGVTIAIPDWRWREGEGQSRAA